MNIQDQLAAQRTVIMQQLSGVDNETILMMVEQYIRELVALQHAETPWTEADEVAIKQGLTDLDAGQGISWGDFRSRFARYEA
ncbi:MAG: hypothetical protein U0176_18335 [Bacteroidia bacterium]